MLLVKGEANGSTSVIERRSVCKYVAHRRDGPIGVAVVDQQPGLLIVRLCNRIGDFLRRADGGGDRIVHIERIVAAHCASSWLKGGRLISRSLKSNPDGGRAMRARRPSYFQRQAQSRAAA